MVKPYYEDASVTLYHGEACSVLAELPPASVDALVTDPPYSSGGMFRGDRARPVDAKYTQPAKHGGEYVRQTHGTFTGDTRDQRAWMAWVSSWSWLAFQATRPGGWAFVFSDWRQLPAATDAIQTGGWLWRGVLAWDKGAGRGLPIRGLFRSNVEFVVAGTAGPFKKEGVVEFPGAIITAPIRSDEDGRKEHPTQKPVALFRHLFSVMPPGPMTILDPFAGSGSSLVAAKEGGHRAVGVEIDERYCEIIANRVSRANPLPLGSAA